jgi:hypothetical protein
MAREVMAESLAQPKRGWALDTDWTSAPGAVGLFVICAFLGVATSGEILRGIFKAASLSGWTPWFAGLDHLLRDYD